MLSNSSSRFSLLFYLGGFYCALGFILRVILFFSFGLKSNITYLQLPFILGLGFLNDVIEAVYLLLPLSFYLFFMPEKWYQSKFQQVAMLIFVSLFVFFMLYLAAVQFYFFQEYTARFNLVAVDYLIYPSEVLGNIWDSYPVAKVCVAMLLVSTGLMWKLWPKIKTTIICRAPFRKRSITFVGHCVLLAFIFFVFDTHSFDFSDNRITNEITANGDSSFFEALRTNKLDYTAYYSTLNPAQAFSTLVQNLAEGGGQFTQLAAQKINRSFVAKPKGLGKLNVVVIVDESFGARFNGAYHAKKDLTPYFDRLAKQGILFNNSYATGTRTVRGLEAVTASFPPIPSESIIKRPGSEHIANWGEIMKKNGYSATFLYGGYGVFDNMNHFYENNGFQIRDRSDIKKVSFANIWGVCDGDLFNYTLDYLNQQAKTKKPFFSIIMTTSNHKPFTYPAGIPGVKPVGGGRDSGVRYTDYAIGQFIQAAKKQAWFNHTIFVIVADHDARVYGAAELPVYSYRIPLLIYSPANIPARQVDLATSQMDIAPTVLGLLGFSYEAPFFGEDVLHWDSSKPKIILMNHDHDVALMQGNKVVVLSLMKKIKTYDYDTKTGELKSVATDPELSKLAQAYYQEAYRLFKNHLYV